MSYLRCPSKPPIQAWTILQRAVSHQPHITVQLQKILEPIALPVATKSRAVRPQQEITKIYSTVGIEERRAVLNKWFDPRGIIS